MKLDSTYKHTDELVKPTQFKLTSNTVIIERLVDLINDYLKIKLENNLSVEDNDIDNEIYEDSFIEFECDNDDEEYDAEVVKAVIDIFENFAGWPKVEYRFVEETEEEYAHYSFFFYFKDDRLAEPYSELESNSDLDYRDTLNNL